MTQHRSPAGRLGTVSHLPFRPAWLLLLAAVVGTGCGADPVPAARIDGPEYDAGNEEPVYPAPEELPEPVPTPRPRVVAGTLLVEGRAEIEGITNDGHLAHLREPPSEDLAREDWSADLLDVTTGVSQMLARRQSVNDSMVAINDVVGLWTAGQSVYGWSSLSVWTPANGLVAAPEPTLSLPKLLAVDSTSTRIAFSYGDFSAGGITNFAVAAASLAAAPVIVAPRVGRGCPSAMQFAGKSVLVSACEGDETIPILRWVDESNVVTELARNARSYAADATGAHVLVVDAEGAATVRSAGGSTPLDVGVRSGALSPDGTTVVYTNETGQLKRASLTDLANASVLAEAGMREIVSTAPDFSHAVISSREGDATHQGARDLQLVSLVDGQRKVLVASSTGAVRFFTRSSTHLFYFDQVPESGVQGLELHVVALAGGEPRLLDTTLYSVTEPPRSHLVTWLSAAAGYPYAYRAFDLDASAPATTVIESVTGALTYANRHYVTVEDQGLYLLD